MRRWDEFSHSPLFPQNALRHSPAFTCTSMHCIWAERRETLCKYLMKQHIMKTQNNSKSRLSPSHINLIAQSSANKVSVFRNIIIILNFHTFLHPFSQFCQVIAKLYLIVHPSNFRTLQGRMTSSPVYSILRLLFTVRLPQGKIPCAFSLLCTVALLTNATYFFIWIHFVRISTLKFAKFKQYLKKKPKAEIMI